MKELTILIEMVSQLPQMALWVLIGFFAYKVICVGSIYGVMRLFIIKMHSWLTKTKEELVNHKDTIDNIVIGDIEGLIMQIERLRGISCDGCTLNFIHQSDIEWLKDAIDEKLIDEKLNNPE